MARTQNMPKCLQFCQITDNLWLLPGTPLNGGDLVIIVPQKPGSVRFFRNILVVGA